MTSDKTQCEDHNLFLALPEDLACLVVHYLDVASIVSLSQILSASRQLSPKPHESPLKSFNPPIMSVCNSEYLWAYLIEQRFAIPARNGRHRARTYGGSTWKHAYESLSSCNRIPTSKVTSKRKTIFAKSSSRSGNGVSFWVLMGHSEDCRVREVGSQIRTRTQRSTFAGMVCCEVPNELAVGTRYVEMHLCFQLNSSTSSKLEINLADSFVDLLGSNQKHKNIILSGALMPRIIHRSLGRKDTTPPKQCYCQSSYRSDALSSEDVSAYNPDSLTSSQNFFYQLEDIKGRNSDYASIIAVKPMEFVVVAVNVLCPTDMVFETDFLSSAVSVRVPMVITNYVARRPRIISQCSNCCQGQLNQILNLIASKTDNNSSYEVGHSRMLNASKKHKSEKYPTDFKWVKVSKPGWLVATFIEENEIMSCYMELPGHCMALSSSVRTAFS